jgi:hypothetical protein
MNEELKRNAGLALAALLTTSGTLVCCVLPVLMVALGAGASLAALVSAVPQLVWLSEHKGLVFGCAALALLVAGAAIWRGRTLPCPTEQHATRQCMRLRRISAVLFAIALAAYCVAVAFAFVIPRLI